MPADIVSALPEQIELGTAKPLPLYKEDIARALDLIDRDSRLEPQRYLQETTVPHGGE